jgi:nucleoside-diphosphate-sugar epimerase
MKTYSLLDFDESILDHGAAYGENIKRAETVFFQKLKWPYTAVRFCIVIGKDDTFKRLIFHCDKISKNQPLFLPNIEAKMSLITQEDASDILRLIELKKMTEGF